MRLLMDLADAAEVAAHRDAMFAGDHINTTEDRAVLHVALRMPPGSVLHVDGQDVVGDVQAVLAKMGDLSDRIRNGQWTGATGSGSPLSSTSASAVRTLARPWPPSPWPTTPSRA